MLETGSTTDFENSFQNSFQFREVKKKNGKKKKRVGGGWRGGGEEDIYRTKANEKALGGVGFNTSMAVRNYVSDLLRGC